MEELHLADYMLLFKRNRKLFCCIAGILFVLCFLFAIHWSNYKAIATVEVAQSEIPDVMTAPTGVDAGKMLESLADMRISRLQQKVLATGSLVEVITKFNLYDKQRQTTPIAEIAENMRKKINLSLVSTSLANPASAQKVSADQLSAIAFKISFAYKTPLLAQQVTNELVSRFLDEDLKERRRQAKETAAFLDSQIQILDASLKEQEKQIAAFRAEHGDVRPEALAFNQQAAASTTLGLQNLDSQITANLGTQGVLRGQLASVDPYSRVLGEGRLLTTPTIQLKTLQSDYAALTAKYGPSHPDVLKAKRQIEALEGQLGKTGGSAALEATILDVRGRLDAAEKTYGAANPEVASLKRQLANLEAQRKANGNGATELIVPDADNPAYLQIAAQLRATEEQHKALMTQKKALEEQQMKYQRAIIENPSVEQKMASLSRDYDNAQLRYRDLKAKKMAADMAATIEEDRSGQRLVVIEPPELPTKTTPSRLLFLAAGFLFSLFGATGALFVLQLSRQTILGSRHLAAVTGIAPLVVVPHIVTGAEKSARREKLPQRVALTFAVLAVLLIVFSYAIMPLDVLWAVIARRLGF